MDKEHRGDKVSNRIRSGSRSQDTRRASISLPAGLYRELEQIAKQKKVSLAWVIRDAAEVYLAEKYPLFSRKPEL